MSEVNRDAGKGAQLNAAKKESSKWKWISVGLGVACLIAVICAIVIPLTMDTGDSYAETPEENSYDYEILPTQLQSVFDSLTFEQKLGQMNQYTSGDLSGPTAKFSIDDIKNGKTGSLFNVDNVTMVNYYQDLQKQSPVQIPLIIGYDTIHGYKTQFPINLGLAATWDATLVRKCFEVAADESARDGTMWAFTPMLDIFRDSRWGRGSESFGEDPYLDSVLAAASVKGLQEGPGGKVASCVKHFAGYGGGESGRDYNLVDMSLQRMHSEYLPAYKAAIDAGAWSVMASFNTMNYQPATSNHYLLTDVLKRNWGFAGPIVSDYDAVWELNFHQVAKDDHTAGVIAVNAGMDMEMAHGVWSYNDMLKNAVNNGEVDMKRIDDAVKRILRLKWQVGLFGTDGTPKWVWDTEAAKTTLTRDSLDLSIQAGSAAAVLLKNGRTFGTPALPITQENMKAAKVLVVGKLADSKNDTIGGWSARGWWTSDSQAAIDTFKVAMDQSLLAAGGVASDYEFGHAGFDNHIDPQLHVDAANQTIQKIINASPPYTHIFAVVGEAAMNMSGEATSRTDLTLGYGQTELLDGISQVLGDTTQLITLVYSGRGLAIEHERNISDALIQAWFPGTQGAHGLMRLINGTDNFKGRLPITIPRTVGQCPIYYGRPNTGRPLDHASDSMYSEFDYSKEPGSNFNVHYKSRYMDSRTLPLYPFGFGLTYSKFKYETISLTPTSLSSDSPRDTPITVKVLVTNESPDYDGEEVVQIYVHHVQGQESRPERMLRAFQRVAIPKGQQVTVTLSLTLNDFGYYKQKIDKDYSIFHTDIDWVIDAGEFTVFAQPNAIPDFDISQADYDPAGMWGQSAPIGANLTLTE